MEHHSLVELTTHFFLYPPVTLLANHISGPHVSTHEGKYLIKISSKNYVHAAWYTALTLFDIKGYGDVR